MAEGELFPAIEPYRTAFLPVSARHNLYYEEVGNPRGVPIVFLHGGPAAGFSPTTDASAIRRTTGSSSSTSAAPGAARRMPSSPRTPPGTSSPTSSAFARRWASPDGSSSAAAGAAPLGSPMR